jgi:hypothetical protein
MKRLITLLGGGVAAVGDPVGSRFLARPGGNITGFASHAPSMGGKWLEVLKETAPHVTRASLSHRQCNGRGRNREG